mmetsp:Transcript_3130/g.11287  ORF Transcript_3130/g.11287 Transcript_3130/m.11287 type:complete len:358 (+) Transcript_3130:219-1292(+)
MGQSYKTYGHSHLPGGNLEVSRGPSALILDLLLSQDSPSFSSGSSSKSDKENNSPLRRPNSPERLATSPHSTVPRSLSGRVGYPTLYERVPNLVLDATQSSTLLSPATLQYTKVLLPLHERMKAEEQARQKDGKNKSSCKCPKAKIKRERASSSSCPKYRASWANCKWEIFLPGHKAGYFSAASKTPEARSTSTLLNKPAVYEFAISRGPRDSMKKVKVYLGQTRDAKRRMHCEYRSNGSHLLPFFEHALDQGYVGKTLLPHGSRLTGNLEADLSVRLAWVGLCSCVVWRRVRYFETKEEAKQMEEEVLRVYDFAWNERLNGATRALGISPSFCGLCSRLEVDLNLDPRKEYGRVIY